MKLEGMGMRRDRKSECNERTLSDKLQNTQYTTAPAKCVCVCVCVCVCYVICMVAVVMYMLLCNDFCCIVYAYF